MKRFSVFAVLLFLFINMYAQYNDKIENALEILDNRGEVVLKIQKDKVTDVKSFSKIVSIDKLVNDEIYFYANRKQFKRFIKEYQNFDIDNQYYESPQPKVAKNLKGAKSWETYPTYEQYLQIMVDFQNKYPELCQIDTISTSTEGRLILAAVISDNIKTKETEEPEFYYTSTMHGDELAGYVLMLRLIDYLLTNYGSDARVNNLVNNIEIWITPLANPDGTYAGGNNTVMKSTRGNANWVDLNRNFLDPADGENPDGYEYQKETLDMMEFMRSHRFILSANYHSGEEVFNYPWDTWYERHPDDDFFIQLAKEYCDTVFANTTNSYYFKSLTYNGYTNGYDWYPVAGGRQDFTTYFCRGREVTIEIDVTKKTPESELAEIWEWNYRSMLNYMEHCLYTLHGKVTDSETGQPLEAKVELQGLDWKNSDVFSYADNGLYFRLKNPGTYNVCFTAEGYDTLLVKDVVIEQNKDTELNVALNKIKTIVDKTHDIIASNGEAVLEVKKDKISDINAFSKIVSIDNVKDDIIRFYVNELQFNEFLQTFNDFTIVNDSFYRSDVKMAASVDEAMTWNSYPTYEQYLEIMYGFQESYPELCRLDTIGFSMDGRLVLAAKISDNVNNKEAEPEFFYSSTMHGDEIAGYVLMLRLIDTLLENYGTNSEIDNLVNNIEIWINPLANPDGTYAGGNHTMKNATRGNRNYVDLNRNFPDPEEGDNPDGQAYQQETLDMINFMHEHNFVLSANFHAGAEVMCYPWDTFSERHTDDAWWQIICNEYTDSIFANSTKPYYFKSLVSRGYMNGYDWYPVAGSRADYMIYNCRGREATIEIDNTKMTPAENLEMLWQFNSPSLLLYIGKCLYGISGKVIDATTGEALRAKLELVGYDKKNSEIYSDSITGMYYRMPNAGNYTLRFVCKDYKPLEIEGVEIGINDLKVLDVQLEKYTTGIEINKQKDNITIINPAKGELEIKMNIEKKGELRIELFDISGKKHLQLPGQFYLGGEKHINVDISGLPEGLYLCNFTIGEYNTMKKIIILR